MKEGKYKTNIKPVYWECKGCENRAPDHRFKHGALWWKSTHCPKCNSNRIEYNPTKILIKPTPIPIQRFEDKIVLKFIYNRMLNFHLENPRYDYMIKFKEIIDK